MEKCYSSCPICHSGIYFQGAATPWEDCSSLTVSCAYAFFSKYIDCCCNFLAAVLFVPSLRADAGGSWCRGPLGKAFTGGRGGAVAAFMAKGHIRSAKLRDFSPLNPCPALHTLNRSRMKGGAGWGQTWSWLWWEGQELWVWINTGKSNNSREVKWDFLGFQH